MPIKRKKTAKASPPKAKSRASKARSSTSTNVRTKKNAEFLKRSKAAKKGHKTRKELKKNRSLRSRIDSKKNAKSTIAKLQKALRESNKKIALRDKQIKAHVKKFKKRKLPKGVTKEGLKDYLENFVPERKKRIKKFGQINYDLLFKAQYTPNFHRIIRKIARLTGLSVQEIYTNWYSP